ncbi:MAG TPA: DNA-3-methyladenine glycosylase [Candidatus Polarisedimenticolia bacterium]|nr:DNA-3-methyladenine glycosylase [Candidatus Polarisedimenticolia bacterium]
MTPFPSLRGRPAGGRLLPGDFYLRSALEVAPDLLGKLLCRRRRGVVTAGRIVEVEAYLGADDPASHAHRGPTPRNRAMFGPGGRAYVYFTYGNHYCMNVVTGPRGVGSGVLLRALEPTEGIETMRRRRGTPALEHLASGPGRLAQALAIDAACCGHDLGADPLWLEDDGAAPPACLATPRIGIRKAADRLYRFIVPDSRFVSRPRLGPLLHRPPDPAP